MGNIFYEKNDRKDDGSLTILKVDSELDYSKYDEVVTNKLHSARVMGIYIDSISEFIYSVGEDKKFKVYDLRKNELTAGNGVEIFEYLKI